MIGLPAFALELGVDVLAAYAADRDWPLDVNALRKLKARQLQDAVAKAYEKAETAVRDQIDADITRVEKFVRDRMGALLRDAFGTDRLAEFERLPSDRSRAIWLLLNDEDAFDLAEEEEVYRSNIGAGSWQGYILSGDFSRDWTPEHLPKDSIASIVARVVKEVEGADRQVEAVPLKRPTTSLG
jgi:hypothetical protein